MDVVCPWGNRFRCHPPAPEFGDVELGMPYVAFDAPVDSAQPILRFCREILGACGTPVRREDARAAAPCDSRPRASVPPSSP